MDRYYVPLLPASALAGDGDDDGDGGDGDGVAVSSADALQVPDHKKRRLGVSVACNTCRRRKIRCDGQRPTCTNCNGSTTECSYRDASGLSNESRKIVLEIIRILNGIPDRDTIRTLRLLSTETNAPIILSTLRDKATVRTGSSAHSIATAPPKPHSVSRELEENNPVAYPAIARADGTRHESDNPDSRPRTMLPNWIASTENNLHEEHLNGPYSMAHDMSASSPISSTADQHDGFQYTRPNELCDSRLKTLNIHNWTDVAIDNDMAASCISLYLETDHPLLGHFDPDLFMSDLVSHRYEHCSSLLVNALLYWACQMYSSVEPKTSAMAMDFCVEAERLWAIESHHNRDSVMNIAALEFLCLGYLGQGRDHAILVYVSEAAQMGQRMALFGVENQQSRAPLTNRTDMVDEPTRARMYAAWGVFNWLTLMSLFYRQPGMLCPKYLPQIAIPECTQPISREYMGTTFTQICRFWSIMQEVSIVYSGDRTQNWGFSASVPFAEFKFRELLAWSNNLPSRLMRGHDHIHHVQILHLWFHAAILDIFRPLLQTGKGDIQLRTFSSEDNTPTIVFNASVAQLKHLIADYRLNYSSSTYTILWHTALVYVINAILAGGRVQNWYTDLLLCLYAYESLGRSWRVAAGIAKGLLSLALQKTDMPSGTARRILNDLQGERADSISGEIRATFMVDLELAQSHPDSATVEHLARRFEENVLLKDYTTLFEEEVDTSL